MLRLWNPYVTQKATATIKSHNAPIEMVEIDAENNIFISIDIQKNIKVWNLGKYCSIDWSDDERFQNIFQPQKYVF